MLRNCCFITRTDLFFAYENRPFLCLWESSFSLHDMSSRQSKPWRLVDRFLCVKNSIYMYKVYLWRSSFMHIHAPCLWWFLYLYSVQCPPLGVNIDSIRQHNESFQPLSACQIITPVVSSRNIWLIGSFKPQYEKPCFLFICEQQMHS